MFLKSGVLQYEAFFPFFPLFHDIFSRGHTLWGYTEGICQWNNSSYSTGKGLAFLRNADSLYHVWKFIFWELLLFFFSVEIERWK